MDNSNYEAKVRSGIAIVLVESILIGVYFLVMALGQLGLNRFGIELGLFSRREIPFLLIIGGLVGYLALIWTMTYRVHKSQFFLLIKYITIGAAVAFTYFAIAFTGISIFGSVIVPTLVAAVLISGAIMIILGIFKSTWQYYFGSLWGVVALAIYIAGSYLAS